MVVKVSFPVSHLLRNAGVAQKFWIFKKSCSGGLGWLCSGQGGTKPVQDRAAHRAGKQKDVRMGTNLSAEGSGEQRKADLSWNLVLRCRVPGQLLPPAGKHQFPRFHGRNGGFAAALCCFITLCCFCLSSLAAPGL